MSKDDEERTAARDFVMARLAACRAALSLAEAGLDGALQLFLVPEDDAKGKDRTELLEAVDDHIGEAARAVQLAQTAWPDCDPSEEEPEPEEDDEEDEDEEDEDEEEDDSDRKRR